MARGLGDQVDTSCLLYTSDAADDLLCVDLVDVSKNFSFRNPPNYINIAYFKNLLIVTKKIGYDGSR